MEVGAGRAPQDSSAAYLAGRMAVVEARVGAAVASRRAVDPAPDDGLRGLYLSEAQVDRLLSPGSLPGPDAASETLRVEVERLADLAEREGSELRLRRLARAFGLGLLDVELLLVALAPELDPRFEQLYGYLHDDLTRRRASIGLALELAGVPWAAGAGRSRLRDGGPLVDGGLVVVGEPERPFLTRPLRVPDRVVMHLLGDDQPDCAVAQLLVDSPPCGEDGEVERLAVVLSAGIRLVYLRERAGTSGTALAAATFAGRGQDVLILDLRRLGERDPLAAAEAAIREARLHDTGLVAGPVEALLGRGQGALHAFSEAARPVILTGTCSWEPAWSSQVPLILEVPEPAPARRTALWRASLNGTAAGGPDAGLDLAQVTEPFRLTPEQIRRAAVAASRMAELAARPLQPSDLRTGARWQSATGLQRLARRIEPAVGWQDLVLPDEAMRQLQELEARVCHRHRVLDEWRVGGAGTRGRGVTALFAGASGTGKTMAAEALAGALGLDLYATDLATVVDKYVGETEKHLDRVFAEADGVNGVLFFDEAEALFGKRSEVRDAHDRYANIEVAYLLQRVEAFDGVVVLATNLRANLDEAFTRRLGMVVEFPMPDERQRRRLWDRCIGPRAPRAPDLDLDFLAGAFELSGGSIRNVVVAAAFAAAAGDHPLGMAQLVQATEREHHKLGRLCDPALFGPYLRLVVH